jgi:hypothetical protein
MLPRPATRALASLLLVGSALSWLSLAGPAAAADPSAAPSAGAQTQCGTLCVSTIGAVDDTSAYPNVTVNLSVAEKATGRPAVAGTVFAQSQVKVSTPSPSTGSIPAAYSILIDTSGSMSDKAADGRTYMQHAVSLATAFVNLLSAEDMVTVVLFDTTVRETTWYGGRDPKLLTLISQLQPTKDGRSYIGLGMERAAALVQVYPGFNRKAVLVITDADQSWNDPFLKTGDLTKNTFPPTFIVGLRPAASVGTDLSASFTTVAAFSGGKYVAAETAPDDASLVTPVRSSTQSTWAVTLSPDPAPVGSHDDVLTVTDAAGQTGTVAIRYQSAGLFKNSSIDVKNDDGSVFNNGATLTADQAVTISVGGYSAWKGGYHFELYVGCGLVDNDVQRNEVNLTGCPKPMVGVDKTALPWSMPVSLMNQGTNYAVVRLVTSYGNQDYDVTATIHFVRSGTTWNVAVVILVGGMAILLVGAFFIASRGRGQKRRKRAAR